MADLKYCYPNSHVLINKLNIHDYEKLEIAERKITSINEISLRDKPIKGDFDFKHLQKIHKKLFDDIYDWAGELRQVNIGKGGNWFCDFRYLQPYGNNFFSHLQEDNYLIGMEKEKAIERLAEYIDHINALHPFREGNGRSQRLFIEYAAKAAGFNLAFEKTNSEEMYRASVEAFSGDTLRLKHIFNEIAEPLLPAQQRKFLKSVSDKAAKIYDMLNESHKLPDREAEFGIKN